MAIRKDVDLGINTSLLSREDFLAEIKNTMPKWAVLLTLSGVAATLAGCDTLEAPKGSFEMSGVQGLPQGMFYLDREVPGVESAQVVVLAPKAGRPESVNILGQLIDGNKHTYLIVERQGIIYGVSSDARVQVPGKIPDLGTLSYSLQGMQVSESGAKFGSTWATITEQTVLFPLPLTGRKQILRQPSYSLDSNNGTIAISDAVRHVELHVLGEGAYSPTSITSYSLNGRVISADSPTAQLTATVDFAGLFTSQKLAQVTLKADEPMLERLSQQTQNPEEAMKVVSGAILNTKTSNAPEKSEPPKSEKAASSVKSPPAGEGVVTDLNEITLAGAGILVLGAAIVAVRQTFKNRDLANKLRRANVERISALNREAGALQAVKEVLETVDAMQPDLLFAQKASTQTAAAASSANDFSKDAFDKSRAAAQGAGQTFVATAVTNDFARMAKEKIDAASSKLENARRGLLSSQD